MDLVGGGGAFTERESVELPFVEQLKGMGWSHIEGDQFVPDVTERTSFRHVLLYDRLRRALPDINIDAVGQPWLDRARIEDAIGQLERASATAAGGLVATNQAVFEMLTKGALVEGIGTQEGRDVSVAFIDFAHPERNDFLAINQFRVDPVAQRPEIIPDIVLFVNGIPIVVVECKSAAVPEPIEDAIDQLRRYSNQRGSDTDEGVERLFHYNALLVATDYHDARMAAVGAAAEHFAPWADTAPVPQATVASELGVEALHAQELLVAGVLRPAHLLDLVWNFTVFDTDSGRLIKKVARYQQFRAVVWACEGLLRTPDRTPGRREDGRGGVIWQTQGSGKSLSMVFLVRRMRTIEALKAWKVVVVTDRKDLQKQLGDTAQLAGEVVDMASSRTDLITKLSVPGGLLMAMIQKYRPVDEPANADEMVAEAATFPVCNVSGDVLLLVDEAHRSQTGPLHMNLILALPNAAKIAFTGTPILMGDRRLTNELFGPFIDIYTIKMSEADGATVPIIYEGRESRYRVSNPDDLDAALVVAYPDVTPEQLEAIRRRYVRPGAVLEAPRPIEAKAEDVLRHYIETVLPNGFKAQLVANSRRAAIRYRNALANARDRLVADLEANAASLAAIPADTIFELAGEEGFRARAFRQLHLLRTIDFAAVISGLHNDEPDLDQWSDEAAVKARIAAFKKPLVHPDPAQSNPLAFLCVKSMLLTGFDAPVEQVLYIDRPMQGAELLQAIARVNRTNTGKTHGLIVDYINLGTRLSDALDVYAREDVEGLVSSFADEVPRLEHLHGRVLATFTDARLDGIGDVNACIDLLADAKVRGTFSLRLREFLAALDAVLPRPEALPFLRDAKTLGKINAAATTLYRDRQMGVLGAGKKVQAIIDAHLDAEGINRRIEPISILDTRFDETVRQRPSPRTRASEMEHAIRHHISVHYGEDPALFRNMAERLQEILDAFAAQWDQLVLQLGTIVSDIRGNDTAIESAGLDPRIEAPFWRVLTEALDDSQAKRDRVAPTRELVELIRAEVTAVDFWRNIHAQELLRAHVYTFLDTRDLVPYARLNQVADEVMEIARFAHGRLIG
jgi:type I restriction enzyme R subunit